MMPRRLPGNRQQALRQRILRVSVRITPAVDHAMTRRHRDSMTPKPVRSVPQSMPRTRTAGEEARLRERLHLLFVDVEVGEDVLHVVVLFERFEQFQQSR